MYGTFYNRSRRKKMKTTKANVNVKTYVAKKDHKMTTTNRLKPAFLTNWKSAMARDFQLGVVMRWWLRCWSKKERKKTSFMVQRCVRKWASLYTDYSWQTHIEVATLSLRSNTNSRHTFIFITIHNTTAQSHREAGTKQYWSEKSLGKSYFLWPHACGFNCC